MRPLHITKSVESPVSYKLTSVYFQLLILKHGILFSNSSSTNRFLLLHSHFYTGIPSHYIHHFIVKGSSSPFPVANTHPQLLLKLHPDFGVCHIHLPSVPCDNFSIFFTQGLDLECIARAKLSIIQTHFSHSLVYHDLMLRYILYIQKNPHAATPVTEIRIIMQQMSSSDDILLWTLFIMLQIA